MKELNFNDNDAVGYIASINKDNVTVQITEAEYFNKKQATSFAVFHTSRAGHYQIGIMQKPIKGNLVEVNLIGTLFNKLGTENNVLLALLEVMPEAGANCFLNELEF